MKPESIHLTMDLVTPNTLYTTSISMVQIEFEAVAKSNTGEQTFKYDNNNKPNFTYNI
jgi:hypothetical protein